MYEIEVKVSRSDFLADFKKKEKHEILAFGGDVYTRKGYVADEAPDVEEYFRKIEDPDGYQFPSRSHVQFFRVERIRPNKFAFAVPEGLVSEEEIPDYAGLITVDKHGHPYIQKAPPMLHRAKQDLTKVLLDKYYWAYLRMLDQQNAGKNFKLVGE